MAVLDFPSAIGPVQEAIQKDPSAGTLQQMVLGEFGSRQQGMADQAAMAREMLKSKDAIAKAAALQEQNKKENIIKVHGIINAAKTLGIDLHNPKTGDLSTIEGLLSGISPERRQTGYAVPVQAALMAPTDSMKQMMRLPARAGEPMRFGQHTQKGRGDVTGLPELYQPQQPPSPAKPTMPPVKPQAAATTAAQKADELPYATRMTDLMAGRPPRRASEGTKVNTEIVDLAPEDKDRIFKVIEAHPRYAGKIAAVHGLTADGNYVWVQMKGEDGEPKRLPIESLKNR